MAESVSKHLEVKEDYQQADEVARMILLDLGYSDEIDKISCRWVNSGSRNELRS